jgi:hypothetical protein
MMMASLIQIAGATLVSIGVGIVFPPAGIVMAGALAIVFGISLEKK